jgi:IclR family transcriptional regulator, acetate operon repressor
MTIDAQNDSSGGIQVIERAGQILRLLGLSGNELTPSQIGAELGLARSTAHRILTALEREELVQSTKGRYRLGPAIEQLAVSARDRFVAAISPYLEQMCLDLGETVQLCIPDGDRAIVIAQVPSRQDLRVEGAIGSRRPFHCTATGKVLLAELSTLDVESLLPRDLARYTETTIVDRSVLLGELERVRGAGFAISNEEFTPGVCSISVALHGTPVGTVAVAVPTPASRFYGREDALAADFMSYVATARAALGYGF